MTIESMKISVVGIGYVGLSVGLLLAQQNNVFFLDTNPEKINYINKKISPIVDSSFNDYILRNKLSFCGTTNPELAYENASIIIIAVPTDLDINKTQLDTTNIEKVLSDIQQYNPSALVVIKSTLPVGFTSNLNNKKIVFSPEFLRQNHALNDALNPDRVVIGDDNNCAGLYVNAIEKTLQIDKSTFHYTSTKEAEAIKLFSNAYLAMRIAFFNELDTFAISNDLNTKQVIEGVCADKRIGDHYNIPSDYYAGSCLPKDTIQLASQANQENHELLGAITLSNKKRQRFKAG